MLGVETLEEAFIQAAKRLGISVLWISDKKRKEQLITSTFDFNGGEPGQEIEKGVFQVDYAPFDYLLPKVSLVVCHGGAGTVFRAIGSGVPVVICPVITPIIADQMLHAQWAERKGFGAFLRPLEPTIQECEEALQKALACKGTCDAAAAKVKQEDGAKAAAAAIEQLAEKDDTKPQSGCCAGICKLFRLVAFLGLIPALHLGRQRRCRPGRRAAKQAVEVAEEATSKPRWQAKRLAKPTAAQRKWGGMGFDVRGDGLALRPKPLKKEQATKVKWKPKRESWQAWVTDDESEAFGPLLVGHEVEVFWQKYRSSAESWVQGVVMNVGTEEDVSQAKIALTNGKSTIVTLGRGLLRRREDAAELLEGKDATQMAKLRAQNEPKELMRFGLKQTTVSGRSQDGEADSSLAD
ncbi:unnamed protein product, partial [Durusdinium trenchii]